MPDPAKRTTGRIRACQECRRLKAKCDGVEGSNIPCLTCVRLGSECVYGAALRRKDPSKRYVAQLETRVHQMQELLRKHVSKTVLAQECGPSHGSNSAEDAPLPFPETYINAENQDDPLLSSQTLRSAQSAQHFQFDWYTFTPSSQSESEWDDSSNDPEGETRYFGKSSDRPLIATALEIRAQHEGMEPMKLPQRIEPTPKWRMRHCASDEAESSILPSDNQIRKLSELYFCRVNSFLPVLDRPAFEKMYADGQHIHDSRFSHLVYLVCALGSFCCPKDASFDSSYQAMRFDAGYVLSQASEDVLMPHGPPTLLDMQIHVLTVLLLHHDGNIHASWLELAYAVRLAQDVGIHRKTTRRVHRSSLIESEGFTRAFWCLLLIDRLHSATLGHSVAIHEPFFDLPLPTLLPHEKHDPNVIITFTAALQLCQIYSATLYFFYSARPGPVHGTVSEAVVVKQLETRLDRWLRHLPAQLRWDPNCKDDVQLELNTIIALMYCHAVILVHHPLVPAALSSPPTEQSPVQSALDVCAATALTASHVAAVQFNRNPLFLPGPTYLIFTCAVVLLTKIWGKRKEAGPDAYVGDYIAGVHRIMAILRATEQRLTIAGRMVDILVELGSKADINMPDANLSPLDVDIPATADYASLWPTLPANPLLPLNSPPSFGDPLSSAFLSEHNTLTHSQMPKPTSHFDLLDNTSGQTAPPLFNWAAFDRAAPTSSMDFTVPPPIFNYPYPSYTHPLNQWSSVLQEDDQWQEWGDALSHVSFDSPRTS